MWTVEKIVDHYGITLPERIQGIVDGQPCPNSDDPYLMPAVCPATEQVYSQLEESGVEQVDAAVTSARRCFDKGEWSRLPHLERKRIILGARDVLAAHADELAAIQAMEVGLPIDSVKGMHVPRTLENFEFFCEVAGTVGGETFNQTGDYLTIVTREPVGVVAIIAPWNAPTILSSMKMAAALALGNTCVVKGSEHTPLTIQRMVEVLNQGGLPPGVLNLVNGRGPVTGEALVSHPGVDAIGFVGGTATGKRIMASAAQNITKVGLELGGKSANMVLESADLEAAIDGSLLAILSGNGEQCLAGSRLLVQRGIADEFIEQFVSRMSQVRVGDPFDPATEVGPLAFAEHYAKVLSFVDVAKADGAEVLCGGRAHPDFEKGYYFEPTAVLAKDNQARVCQEEIFGPFVAIQIFDTLDDAIAIANDSEFGLVGYVWSNDLDAVMRVCREVRTGTMWVNTPLTRDLRAPFGGYKSSGLGRDGLQSSVDLLTEEKTTMIPTRKLALHKLGMGDSK